MKPCNRLFVILTPVLLLVLFYFIYSAGYIEIIESSTQLKAKIESMGAAGPLIVIVSIALAIIMSPIPSAPIALAAGAIYGHLWGSLYVLIGSTIGAVTAFMIARLLGHDLVQRWFGQKIGKKWIGSQHSLMGIVFLSRLMPFISFDFISYAAGLTTLKFWRFLLATIAGIAPASFFLGHFGGELSSADGQRVGLGVLAIGLIGALPFIYQLIKKRRASNQSKNSK